MRSSRIASAGYTYLTAANLPNLRVRASGSISSFVRGYQPSSTCLLVGVKRWVMHSTVRSSPGTPASSAAAASSSAPYSACQSPIGMIGAMVSPTG